MLTNKLLKDIPKELLVVCPKCKAAISAKCTVPTRDGSKFVAEFCKERTEYALELAETLDVKMANFAG
jgi:hypothetical protein